MLTVVAIVLSLVLSIHAAIVELYSKYVFVPFQYVRNLVFSAARYSVGDIAYVLGGLLLLIMAFRIIVLLFRFKRRKHALISSLLYFLIVIVIAYLWLLLGWGGNYYKAPLSDAWQLEKKQWRQETTVASFDSFLVHKLNDYVAGYRPVPLKQTDDKAWSYYEMYVNKDARLQGVNTKPSLYGSLMMRMGIQGYYNPFTGEAQVTPLLPSFMLPFVVCHEMAHQCGVAAEDDANLLSYALCTETYDSSFRYSAYFNVWLYTHSRLKKMDSIRANAIKALVNPVTLSHVDTLRALYRRYQSRLSNYSSTVYDSYLKFNNQKEGLRSYNKVMITAWALEQKRLTSGLQLFVP